MVVFRGRHKKGIFREIRKNRKNHISGNMAIAGSRMVIFQDHQKRDQISEPRKSDPNFRTTKNRPIFRSFFLAENPDF
jgi:hypothetical protein